MLRVVYVLLLCLLSSTVQSSYNYDVAYNFVSSENIDYDDALNLRYCCSDLLSRDSQKKTQGVRIKVTEGFNFNPSVTLSVVHEIAQDSRSDLQLRD